MRRRHRRSLLLSLFSGLRIAKDAPALSLCREADRLEALHGEDAVFIVRERVQSAPRKVRKHLYRLHDELARRRRHATREPMEGATA